MIRFRKASLPIVSRSGFCQLPVARDAVCHPAIMGLRPLQNSKEWSQGPRVASEDGQEESQSSRTTDAMLTAQGCCWRGLLSGPSGGDTILYPRVARGRPVSTTGHRQPISVVAAALQPPHMWSLSSQSLVLSTASVWIWILPPHLSPRRDCGCQYGISNENSIYSY